MIELGKWQILYVAKKVDFGVYLSASKTEKENTVLLPIKQVKEDVKIGDEIEVFIYRDSKDRMIATTNQPKLQLDEIARLEVKQVTQIGAFLDWGLEKDLFLPFKEQTIKVEEKKDYLVRLYIDKSNRLCATMKLYGYLKQNSPYKRDDMVKGTVYEIIDNFGAFIAVDDKYEGLVPKKEYMGNLKPGDSITGRVVRVKADGKLDLSLKKKAYKQMDDDAAKIWAILEEEGFLDLHDKSEPELIKARLGLSKNAFKRAIGRLLKEEKIILEENGIRKK